MSTSDLLLYTNQQRSANGLALLQVNSLLNSAAQSKAEDMVARNYWSHITPDGKEPWTFVTNAGYQYTSAGENLAYGFMNGLETINGWMNSPTHKENLLNKVYTEVGFGFASSPNFVNNGQQTVIVAFYGTPSSALVHTSAKQPINQNTPAIESQKTEAPVLDSPAKSDITKPVTQTQRSNVTSVLSTKDAKKTPPPTTIAKNIELKYAYSHTLQYFLASLLAPCILFYLFVRLRHIKRFKKYSIKNY